MRLHPEVNSIFLSTSNVLGACRALERLDLPQLPRVVCYDNTPVIRELIRKGLVSAAIGQEPHRQGKEAVEALYQFLAFGLRPEESCVYTENEIFIAENI